MKKVQSYLLFWIQIKKMVWLQGWFTKMVW